MLTHRSLARSILNAYLVSGLAVQMDVLTVILCVRAVITLPILTEELGTWTWSLRNLLTIILYIFTHIIRLLNTTI